ncbi:MAG: fibronectin type III domain-containing protein [Candidatus Eisenbacteria bacterium]|nr:fibronectin type III domain-containing protein [Candidatus Eisenbacteria bacterium]
MTHRSKTLAVVAALLLLSGCARKHLIDPPHNSPHDPQSPGAPAAPGKPGAVTADSVTATSVTLRWNVGDSTGVASYRVYVEGPGETAYQLRVTSTIQHATVANLQTGQSYLFKIAGVNGAGVEGPGSDPIAVRPALLGISLNGGSPYTSNTTVGVQATAPGFNQIRLAARVDSLAGQSYQNLAANGLASFQLTGPDGAKIVYAQFRDVVSGAQSEVLSDRITLDRVAQILSVTENTAGATKTAGQIIHFTVLDGETGGSASVDIASVRTGIRLFDDGTNGDTIADDGTFAVDWTVEPTVDAANAQVIGHFTDRAGNVASPVYAPGLVTIKNPPPAVTLQSAVKQGGGKVLLQWTQSSATDFFSYHVWHSTTSPVLSSASRILDATITVRSTTAFTDSGLTVGTNTFFVVEVVDAGGNSTASNELSVIPTAVSPAPALSAPARGAPSPASGARESEGAARGAGASTPAGPRPARPGSP